MCLGHRSYNSATLHVQRSLISVTLIQAAQKALNSSLPEIIPSDAEHRRSRADSADGPMRLSTNRQAQEALELLKCASDQIRAHHAGWPMMGPSVLLCRASWLERIRVK